MLKKNTLAAIGIVHDFIVVPIEPDTVEAIARGILPRVGIAHHVWHIGIEKQGTLQFITFDNFDSASIVGDALPEDYRWRLYSNVPSEGIVGTFHKVSAYRRRMDERGDLCRRIGLSRRFDMG